MDRNQRFKGIDLRPLHSSASKSVDRAQSIIFCEESLPPKTRRSILGSAIQGIYTKMPLFHNFDRDVTFSVERVEIKLSKFLQWRCGCPSPCSPDGLLAPSLQDQLGQKSFRRRRRRPPRLQPSCPSFWPFSATHVTRSREFNPKLDSKTSRKRRYLVESGYWRLHRE